MKKIFLLILCLSTMYRLSMLGGWFRVLMTAGIMPHVMTIGCRKCNAMKKVAAGTSAAYLECGCLFYP